MRTGYGILCVTADKYELPMIYADTPGEMAAALGIKSSSVVNELWRLGKGDRVGHRKGHRLVRVTMEFSEDEWEAMPPKVRNVMIKAGTRVGKRRKQ